VLFRSVLPFPAGGVFGSSSNAPTKTVKDIEKTLDTMQRQLNELSNAVDEVLKFSEYVDTDDSASPAPPAAA